MLRSSQRSGTIFRAVHFAEIPQRSAPRGFRITRGIDMKSLIAEVADDQFAAAQLIAALAVAGSPVALPVGALAQLLFLAEDEMRELFGSHMTASQAVTYVRTGPASHLLTLLVDNRGSADHG
ncbi:hypothetical protein ACN6K6_007464 [Streptomyces violaceoruber]|uniref:hypothetical protein n=1 Tax=Streptomyces violaceoruber TaxID=1935 RepID=UPI00403C04B7